MAAKLPKHYFLWLACGLLSGEIAAAQQLVLVPPPAPPLHNASPRQGAASLEAIAPQAVVIPPKLRHLG